MSHKRQDTGLSTRDSRRLVLEYLEALDCPRALTCWILFNGGESELVQLVNLQCDPDHYDRIRDFNAAYAATKFLSKTDDLKTGIDTAGVAIEGAFQAERRCLKTNGILRSTHRGHVNDLREDAILRIRGTIAKILGPVPDLLTLPGGWSKGRTTSSSGPTLSPTVKYGSRLDVTASALRYAVRELRDSPAWGASVLNADAPVTLLKEAFTVVQGNVMLTVPKNAKTDRTICYEPHMNIWLQLKVGRYMRERLRRHGIHLDDQSINQRRARLGSKHGHLATIDLKAASDTVAISVVEQLLPVDWVCLLDDLRSKYTFWPDKVWRKNEKFSSMGNGFTFELESLLFYAICSSESDNVSVYGDDIVVASKRFAACLQSLADFGFEANTSKSFAWSSFRESCGDDSYRGASCTPVYLRTLPKSLEDVVKLHNAVRGFYLRTARDWWHPYGALLHRWRKRHPHLLGPEGFGDGHYHVELDQAMAAGAARRAKNWLEGWWFTTLSREYRKGTMSVDGMNYPEDKFFGAICAATGPRSLRSVWSSDMDRRHYRYKKLRVLTSVWPESLWG